MGKKKQSLLVADDSGGKPKATFDWISYAALARNPTLQGLDMLCQCINVAVVVSLIFTDFMMGGHDPYVHGSALVLVATYMWLLTVVVNGIVRIIMEIIRETCDCEDSACVSMLRL